MGKVGYPGTLLIATRGLEWVMSAVSCAAPFRLIETPGPPVSDNDWLRSTHSLLLVSDSLALCSVEVWSLQGGKGLTPHALCV